MFNGLNEFSSNHKKNDFISFLYELTVLFERPFSIYKESKKESIK